MEMKIWVPQNAGDFLSIWGTDCSRFCLTFRPLKIRALGCDETSGSDCPVTRRHTPEERKSHTSIRSIESVQTTCSLREDECVVIDTVVVERVAITAVLTETGADVTIVYRRMRGTRLLGLFMSRFIFAIVVMIDWVYGLKINEFGNNYFRERMGQVRSGAVCRIAVVSRTYWVCIATEKVFLESSLQHKHQCSSL